jgi:hypothetical protein
VALFALDHNYPAPIIDQAKPYLSDVELVSIEDIDPRLPEFEDWELLLALHHDSREWDGMISRRWARPDPLNGSRSDAHREHRCPHDPKKATGVASRRTYWRRKPSRPVH